MSEEKATKTEKNVGNIIQRTYCGEEGIEVVRMDSIDKENHTAEFVIASETPVKDSAWRPPRSVQIRGVILKDYRMNPVVLNQHQRDPLNIIANSLWIKQQEGLLVAKAKFDVDDEIGERIWGKVQRGFVRAASSAFVVLRERMVEAGQIDQATGRKGPLLIATQWKLKEWSIVAVGGDPESLGRSIESPGAEGHAAGADENGEGKFSLPLLGDSFKLH